MELVAPRRLHRGREGRHRPRLPAAPAARARRACSADEVDGHRRRRCARSSPTTPARPACASSSGSSARCCARSPRPVATGERTPPVDGRRRRRARLARAGRGSTTRCAERTAVPGVATGLAVTGAGGDVLFIEATAFPMARDDEPALTLTGQLGDVMKESAQIALSLRALARRGARASTRPRWPSAVPRARARRRGAQGRSVGRRHDGDRAGVACSPARPVRPTSA